MKFNTTLVYPDDLFMLSTISVYSTPSMKRNVIRNYHNLIFRAAFIYCLRPVLVVGFLVCQLSFHTAVKFESYDDESQGRGGFHQTAIERATLPDRLPNDGTIFDSDKKSGNSIQHAIRMKNMKAGRRSVEMYRIMLWDIQFAWLSQHTYISKAIRKDLEFPGGWPGWVFR